VARRAAEAAEIDVAEKTEEKPVPYFETLPRTIIDKRSLDKLLTTLPKEQWEDPPEDHYLYALKCYAEVYGEGKSRKMGWWDYWYLKVNDWPAEEFLSGEELQRDYDYVKMVFKTGAFPMEVPGPGQFWPTGAYFKWRGKEHFAGDQCQTPVTNGLFITQFVNNWAYYREGLKPWQRGLEIGMAHGYFLIGPFTSAGPLRNTPEAATVGLLCGCAVVGLVSVGGLIFGTVIKPTRFDKPGDAQAAGWQEMINWHAFGGLGGAGFAHALITVFGS